MIVQGKSWIFRCRVWFPQGQDMVSRAIMKPRINFDVWNTTHKNCKIGDAGSYCFTHITIFRVFSSLPAWPDEASHQIPMANITQWWASRWGKKEMYKRYLLMLVYFGGTPSIDPLGSRSSLLVEGRILMFDPSIHIRPLHTSQGQGCWACLGISQSYNPSSLSQQQTSTIHGQ